MIISIRREQLKRTGPTLCVEIDVLREEHLLPMLGIGSVLTNRLQSFRGRDEQSAATNVERVTKTVRSISGIRGAVPVLNFRHPDKGEVTRRIPSCAESSTEVPVAVNVLLQEDVIELP